MNWMRESLANLPGPDLVSGDAVRARAADILRPSGALARLDELAGALRSVGDDEFLVVDCLTVWMGNLFAHGNDIPSAVTSLVDALTSRQGPTVVVSNEVGMGIHPETSMGREYRDDLGRLNQAVAAVADTTLLLVAGRAVRLHDPWELL